MIMYCLDTSALLEAAVRSYPMDVFPTLWEHLDEMIAQGELLSPDEVLEELKKKDDALFAWAGQRPMLFYPLDSPLQLVVRDEILATFPRLVDSKKNRSQADPFVVGLAKMTGRIVVTSEKHSGTVENPKIPNVCDHFRIRCISLLQLIRDQGWNF